MSEFLLIGLGLLILSRVPKGGVRTQVRPSLPTAQELSKEMGITTGTAIGVLAVADYEGKPLAGRLYQYLSATHNLPGDTRGNKQSLKSEFEQLGENQKETVYQAWFSMAQASMRPTFDYGHFANTIRGWN